MPSFLEVPMEPRVRLTALLVVLNGERLLGRCLDSLSFCDRILIVDSFSSDATEQIARDHGAIFIQNKWPGNAKQVQYGLDWLEANAPTDWVLMLDCDEIISLDLRNSILAALEEPGGKTSFSMPRLTWDFDGFLRHGGDAAQGHDQAQGKSKNFTHDWFLLSVFHNGSAFSARAHYSTLYFFCT